MTNILAIIAGAIVCNVALFYLHHHSRIKYQSKMTEAARRFENLMLEYSEYTEPHDVA